MNSMSDTPKILSRLFFLLFATLVTSILIVAPKAEAKTFRNAYVSFELPPQWDCYLENTAWECRFSVSKNCSGKAANTPKCKAERKKTKEAIIILTAKEVGAKDSFASYTQHLKAPRPIVTRKKRRAKSKVVHVKPVSIAKQKWVDGMHLGSEVPHYYTRYLATIKGNIAVLVTFSAHKLYYTKYTKDFFNAIKSLRVVATKASTIQKNQQLPRNKPILGGGDRAFEGFDDLGEGGDEPTASSGGFGDSSSLMFLAAFILAALGVYIWAKGRR